MDLTTLIGIIACAVLIVVAIMTKEGAVMFVNVPAMMIVIGGTVGAVLVTYPARNLFSVAKVIKKAFLGQSPDNTQIIGLFETLARKSRREGLLALQAHEEDVADEFYRKGLRLVVDGRETETVQAILAGEIYATSTRHRVGAEIVEKMGVYAPAFGMLGTVIGLIQMLQTMEDPSTIGPSMAVALVTTFYGSLLANVVFLPVAGKLRIRSQEETFYKEMMLEGFLGLLAGDDPPVIKEKLASMLRPKERGGEQKAA